MTNKPFGLIGAGVMGSALLEGLLKHQVVQADHVWAMDRAPASRERMQATLGIETTGNFKPYLAGTQTLLLCVKPHQAVPLIRSLSEAGLPEKTLLISIAAGVRLEQLGTEAPNNPIIRAMPNTPALVGEGMSVLCGNANTTDEHMRLAQSVFKAVGRCLVMEETYFDAITGLSGSGPAYAYLMMEALADGGVRVGLPRDVAMTLVAQTMLGSAKMVLQTGRHPAALRDDVTTPAGCTIAALLSMEDGKIRSVLARAVEEAATTAKGLG
ncbi:MAG: pyrroline-5-carboxylate reductase [Vampirovibrionales bacterium]|nr:pyrroline-5-carboxylate reductase [Vampirovibrionales bacterium]